MPATQLVTGLLTGTAFAEADIFLNEGSLLKNVGECLKYLEKNSPNFDGQAAAGILALPAGVVVVLGSCSAIGGLLNRHYASKLSKEAENYFYGQDAENRLESELVFERIKSRKMEKNEFLQKCRGLVRLAD
jgi:hypothetical protein